MTMLTFKKLLSIAERRGYFRWVPTKLFLRCKYRRVTGKRLHLAHPETFNEKLQALKLLYTRSPNLPRYTKMADKLQAKALVADQAGAEYVIPTLGVWERFDDIPFDDLPRQFVLKTNHDSGGVVICTDKAVFDRQKAKKKLEKNLKRNYYWYGREPQYRDIVPRLFAEPYLTDESGDELKDYKVFCFHGEPQLIQVDFHRFSDHRRNLYTTDWQLIKGEMNYKSDPSQKLAKPVRLEEMLRLSRTLSADIPFLRVDFYCAEGRLYFGEFTFFHGSGTVRFRPESMDRELGQMLHLDSL